MVTKILTAETIDINKADWQENDNFTCESEKANATLQFM